MTGIPEELETSPEVQKSSSWTSFAELPQELRNISESRKEQVACMEVWSLECAKGKIKIAFCFFYYSLN